MKLSVEVQVEGAYLSIYGRAVTGAGKRRKPRLEERLAILALQDSKCLYCDCKLGSVVTRNNKRITLQLNWDHFIPYSYAMRNESTNWVAACHVCNGIKGPRIFDTVMAAQEYIRPRRAAKGYEIFREIPAAAPAPAYAPLGVGDANLPIAVAKAASALSGRLEKNRRPTPLVHLLNGSRASLGVVRDAYEFLKDNGYVDDVFVDGRLIVRYRRRYVLSNFAQFVRIAQPVSADTKQPSAPRSGVTAGRTSRREVETRL